MINVLSPEKYFSYAVNFEKLEGFSLVEGIHVDQSIGVSYPPFPEGLRPGALMSTFLRFSDCVEDEADKIIFDERSAEMRDGFMRFLRGRWPNTIKKGHRLPASSIVVGEWYEATYNLCLQTAPYVPAAFGDLTKDAEGNRTLGVDGAAFFHHCVREILMMNGVMAMLDLLYPPKTRQQRRERKASYTVRRRSQEYLCSIASRIKALEAPTPVEDVSGGEPSLGYFGTLLAHATKAAKQDCKLQKAELKDFVTATRAYIKLASGKDYAVLRKTEDGEVIRDRGPKVPNKKLELETVDVPTLQELSVYFFGEGESVPTSV